MVNVYLIVDEEVYPKVDYEHIGAVLTEIQKSTNNPNQKIGIFIICTVSKVRRREGRWRYKGWLNHSIRIPRETLDPLKQEEVSQLVIDLAKKAMKWDGKAVAA